MVESHEEKAKSNCGDASGCGWAQYIDDVPNHESNPDNGVSGRFPVKFFGLAADMLD
jgi:hypothetical protein